MIFDQFLAVVEVKHRDMLIITMARATTSVLVASVPVILGQPVALSFHRPHVPEENLWGTSISANSTSQ